MLRPLALTNHKMGINKKKYNTIAAPINKLFKVSLSQIHLTTALYS